MTQPKQVCWPARPCPFCGWVPNIEAQPSGRPFVLILCEYKRCPVQPYISANTKRTALTRWNRRAPVAKAKP